MSPKNTCNISSQQMIEWCKSIKNLAATGNSKSIPKLLQKFPIDTTDENYNTLLHYVMELNSDEIVKYLMEAGFDANAANRRNETALVMAIHKNNEKIVKILINYDATVDHKYYPQNNGPLHIAVDKGYVELIKVLLEAGCNVNAKSRTEYTPIPLTAIQIAIRNRNSKVVKILLDAGASRDHTYYKLNEGPLHEACLYGYLKIIKLLLDAGYDVTAKNCTGNTPLHNIMYYRAFVEKPQINEKETEDVIKVLIQAGADVNAADSEGLTPLHMAAEFSDKNKVDLLLNAGADLDTTDFKGCTPLFFSIKNEDQNIFIARRLLEAGADIKKVNLKGRNCVHLAVRRALVDLLILFIEYGAKLDILDFNNMDPLSNALFKRSRDNNRMWIEYKIENQFSDFDGFIENERGINKIEGEIKCIEILCKNGIKIQVNSVRDSYFDFYHSEIVRVLIRQGMTVDFENSKIRHILTSNFNSKLQNVLIKHAAICNSYKNGKGILNFSLEKLNEKEMHYYKDCTEELKNLNDFLICESMPLSKLIESPVSSCFISNEYLIELFKKDLIIRSFPIFHNELTERFVKEKEKYELIVKATLGLRSIIQLDEYSFYPIYRNILQYLITDDMRNVALLANTKTSESSD